MENGGGVADGKISADDVISKIKDDGDFDKLRLKIIRRLKENEELRKSIISTVKQSAVLNRPGAENMKPRQLSDAIHEDVGEKVMSQISDCVWNIIQSGDGMKAEITETVRSVYTLLSNPKRLENGESSSHLMPVQKGLETNGSAAALASEIYGASTDNEPDEPPGFAPSRLRQNGNNNHREHQMEEMRMPAPKDVKVQEDHKREAHCAPDELETGNAELNAPPGIEFLENKQPYDDSDEDPDVPPGFG